MNRREFARLSALLGCTPLAYTVAVPAALAAAPRVSVRSYGAKGDGVSDDTWPVISALIDNPRSTVVVPAGTYLMRNPVYVQGFSGRMECEAGSRFVYVNPNEAGWSFQGGTGAVITGFRAAWRTLGGRRVGSSAGLQLDRTDNTWVHGCTIENSNGAGVLCWICNYPKITNTVVSNTFSNGFAMANCQSAVLMNITANETEDDGLEFASYSDQPASYGAYARNVVINNSRSRGISVTGHSQVEVVDFTINGTASSGVIVCHDRTYNTRTPEAVRFSRGVINNAGTLAPQKGNQFGIEVDDVKSASMVNITTTGSGNKGVSVRAPNGTVTLRDILVNSPRRDSGANLSALVLNIEMLRTVNTPLYGIFINKCGTVNARRLEAVNASQAFSLRRAIWFEDNQRVNASWLRVTDTQDEPTGYVVGAFGATQAGSVTGIADDVQQGNLRVEGRESPALAMVR